MICLLCTPQPSLTSEDVFPRMYYHTVIVHPSAIFVSNGIVQSHLQGTYPPSVYPPVQWPHWPHSN